MATAKQIAYMQAVRLREINYMRTKKGLPVFDTWEQYQLSRPAPVAPTVPTPPAPPPQVGPTTEQRDAFAFIQQILDEYGLGSLAEPAWEQIVKGSSSDEVELWLRGTQEWQDRFPGMTQRTQNGLPQISANEYIQLERQFGQQMRAAGLPEGFYDQPEDFAGFIGADVSINEATQRVNMARDAVFTAPQGVRDELERLYGIGEGDLIAYWIDPDKALPMLERKFQTVQTAAAAQRTGFGDISAAEGEGLTALGVTTEQAQQGFSGLRQSRELFQSLDAGEQALGRDVQLGAAFGNDAEAQDTVAARAKRRTAKFEEAGSFAAGRTGFAGLG